MQTTAPRIKTLVLAALLAAPVGSHAQFDHKLAGSLIGFVSDRAGVPQMGAAVFVYNDYDRLVARALTNEKGAFGFESLLPGLYRVQVRLASFMPAVRENIRIQPGTSSFLSINLASVLSSIELIYSTTGDTPVMSDDWKWVLRTATPARPILRILPGVDITDPDQDRNARGSSAAIFSRTRGLLKLSTGEEGTLAAAGAQSDLGTSFALATSLFGGNELQFAGNFGYALSAGAPTAGFRTSYSNEFWGARPEVAVTMRQVFAEARAGQAFLTGSQENVPRLQTMSVSTIERRQLTDALFLEYGASLESVAFLERLNYFSPFARLTSDLGWLGSVEFAYSSGMPPAELLAGIGGTEMGMESDLTVLALFPRVSLMGGDARVQRTQNFEVNYRKAFGSRIVSAGAYREGVTNSAVMMAAPAGFFAAGDLLPDLASSSSVFNLGDFERMGLRASISQKIGETFSFSFAAGSSGVLVNPAGRLLTNDPEELRAAMREGRRPWAAVRVAGVAPMAGTKFTAGYQWTDFGVVAPNHLYLTSGIQPELGLNIRVQQSLPFGFWSGRMVATAELRNLLAQGYVPISTPDGRTLYLIQNPRAVRGGLSFVF